MQIDKKKATSKKVAVFEIVFSDEVENKGVEPLTPCLQSKCSSQLS